MEELFVNSSSSPQISHGKEYITLNTFIPVDVLKCQLKPYLSFFLLFLRSTSLVLLSLLPTFLFWENILLHRRVSLMIWNWKHTVQRNRKYKKYWMNICLQFVWLILVHLWYYVKSFEFSGVSLFITSLWLLPYFVWSILTYIKI